MVWFKKIDVYLLLLCAVSAVFGMVLISGAAKPLHDGSHLLLVQGIAIGAGVLLFFLVSLIDIHYYTVLWVPIGLFNIVFICTLFFFGIDNGSGNKSWLRVPGLPFNLQPAEFVKLTFIILLALHFYWLGKRVNRVYGVLSLLGHVGLMLGLILASSGDMGMAVVYFFIFLVVCVCSSFNWKWLLGGLVGLAGAVPLVWYYVLENYQKKRILSILYPESDVLGAGWQAAQSKLALQNGGLTGMGLYDGSQVQSKRLPFAHTDFIFSTAGEAFGLIGCMVIVVLLSLIIARCLTTAYRARDTRDRLICVGVGAMLIFQVVENVGMCVGVLPVIGLTLPFFSYGGSSVITMFLALGVVSGVRGKNTRLCGGTLFSERGWGLEFLKIYKKKNKFYISKEG